MCTLSAAFTANGSCLSQPLVLPREPFPGAFRKMARWQWRCGGGQILSRETRAVVPVRPGPVGKRAHSCFQIVAERDRTKWRGRITPGMIFSFAGRNISVRPIFHGFKPVDRLLNSAMSLGSRCCAAAWPCQCRSSLGFSRWPHFQTVWSSIPNRSWIVG